MQNIQLRLTHSKTLTNLSPAVLQSTGMTVAQERRKITAIPQKLSEDDCLNCAEGTGFVLLHAPRMGVNLVSNLRNGLNQKAHDLGICSTIKIASGGAEMAPIVVFLNWRYQF